MRSKEINWIITGYHADNGVSHTKWDKVNSVLNELNDAYKWPKIVYMDINTDTEHRKFKEWENSLARRGWELYNSNQ